jgi:hypothetical protein
VDTGGLRSLDGGVAHVRGSNAETDGNFIGGHGGSRQGGKTTAGFQAVRAEPVVGLRNPEATTVAGSFSLGRVRLDGRQGLIRFENDTYVNVTHYLFSCGIGLLI